jgi:hypothetical protein
MEQQLNQYQENINKVHGQANLLPVNEQEAVRHQITEAKVSIFNPICSPIAF